MSPSSGTRHFPGVHFCTVRVETRFAVGAAINLDFKENEAPAQHGQSISLHTCKGLKSTERNKQFLTMECGTIRSIRIDYQLPKTSTFRLAIFTDSICHEERPSNGLPRNRLFSRDRPGWSSDPDVSRLPSILLPGAHRFCWHKWPSISEDRGAIHGHLV